MEESRIELDACGTPQIMNFLKIRIFWIPWLTLLMGLLAFWAWAGVRTLAPGHIGWVMSGVDTSAQYLGWQFFRQTPWWQWPLGANPAYGSDASGSIVLADCIPLMALSLKAFSRWLPENFQYFGLWALACFLLQAWFARKLLQQFTDDTVIQLAGTAFFLSASIFLVRVYLHPALAAQWLLLAGFCLVVDKRFRALLWLSLLCIAVLVHAYLFVMLAALWGGDLIQRLWRGEYIPARLFTHAAITMAAVLLLMWAVGYFIPGSTIVVPIRTHLDLLFPLWTGIRGLGEWSWFLPASDLDILAYDGFGYLGFGFLLLLVLAICSLIARRLFRLGKIQNISVPTSTWIILTGVCSVLFAYALGNKIYFAQKLLFTYPLLGWLDHLYGIFRAAARMMWPMWYLLLIAAIVLLLHGVRLRYARYVIVLCALIQLGDLSKAAVDVRAATAKNQSWHLAMIAPVWDELAARNRHLVYLQPSTVPVGMVNFVSGYRDVVDYAATHGLTINMAYLAREDEQRLAAKRSARVNLLMQGQAEPSTFYVVADDPLWAKLICVPGSTQWYGTIDGLQLVVPEPPSSLQPMARATCGK
jgi:hypothetical protein